MNINFLNNFHLFFIEYLIRLRTGSNAHTTFLQLFEYFIQTHIIISIERNYKIIKYHLKHCLNFKD